MPDEVDDAVIGSGDRAADQAAERAASAAAAGRYDVAYAEAGEAVRGYRQLVADEPEIYRPDLAATLDELAGLAGALGRDAEALAAAEEAADLFRSLAGPALDRVLGPSTGPHRAAEAAQRSEALAEDDTVLFLPYLAAALSNLSVRRHIAAQHGPALQAAREAVTVYRFLAEPAGPGALAGQTHPADPSAEFRAPLATALGNLANRLDDAGQLTEALRTAQQAAALYQGLAAADPDRYLAPLAHTVNNVAVRQRESGESAVAIATTRQAVNLYRRLADADPDRYRDYLALCLGNLAAMLGDAGRAQSALAAATEVTALYRALAAASERADAAERSALASAPAHPANPQNPPRETSYPIGRYDAALATSLNNLAVRLSQSGQPEAALAATQEAAGLYRRLARNNPQAHLGNLAGVLGNLGADLAAAGRGPEALVAAREAVDVSRRMVLANRPVNLAQLAQAVTNLAVRLSEAGRDASAMTAVREAVTLYGELAGRDPDQYGPALARAEQLAAALRG